MAKPYATLAQLRCPARKRVAPLGQCFVCLFLSFYAEKIGEDRLHMPNHLRKAVPHRRIHTNAYYEWLSTRIRPQLIRTPEQLIHALRFARVMLQSGSVPPNVMPKTGR